MEEIVAYPYISILTESNEETQQYKIQLFILHLILIKPHVYTIYHNTQERSIMFYLRSSTEQ
jgi:uncharacterized membrane protein